METLAQEIFENRLITFSVDEVSVRLTEGVSCHYMRNISTAFALINGEIKQKVANASVREFEKMLITASEVAAMML